MSIGEVSKVRQALREREAIIESGRFSGFRLAHPDALLADWAAHFRSRKTVGQVHRYHTLASAEEVITALTKRQADADGDAAQVGSNSRTDIALSGLTAAEQYASYTRTPRTTAYVRPEALPDIEAYLDLEPVTSGANVILTTPYDDGVFLPPATITGVPIVSEVQTYLDLQRLGGRAEEAAQFLLEKVLRPHWKVEEVD
ncbi:MAG: type IV toxin-antitoxin system AbiEi family antitoxin [Armatimonadota bacterium]